MRLQDISKRVSRKRRTAIQQLGGYKYQVLHRRDFMQMSSTTQINCSYLDIRIKFLIVLSLFHLISIKQIKTTSGEHLDISTNQPLREHLLHFMTWQVIVIIFQTDFMKIIPWSKSCFWIPHHM